MKRMNTKKESRFSVKLKIKETFQTCLDFYSLKPRYRIIVYILIPIISVLFAMTIDANFPIVVNVSVFDFMTDYVNISLTITTLFVTFSMGYLSFIVGGNSDSLNELKFCVWQVKNTSFGNEKCNYQYNMIIS